MLRRIVQLYAVLSKVAAPGTRRSVNGPAGRMSRRRNPPLSIRPVTRRMTLR